MRVDGNIIEKIFSKINHLLFSIKAIFNASNKSPAKSIRVEKVAITYKTPKVSRLNKTSQTQTRKGDIIGGLI